MKQFLSIVLVLSSFLLKAQQYTVTQIPYSPLPFNQGIEVVSYQDDTWGEVIPIGFDFEYFGNSYSSLVLSTNGAVSFNTSLLNSFCPWVISDSMPLVGFPNCILFPFQDMLPGQIAATSGTILHQVYGTPPNRLFVLSFDSVPYFSCTSAYYTGQLILHENNNDIEIQIQHKDTCTQWNAGASILGIQNIDNSEYYVASNYDYPNVWSAYNEAWLFSPDSVYSPINNWNRISGRVFADENTDCTYNGIDYPLMNKPVLFENTLGDTSYIFTDVQGYYSKYFPSGTYNFTTQNIANQYYNTNCPVGGYHNVNFSGLNDSSDNNLFADTIVNYCSDINVGLVAYGEPDTLFGWGFDPMGVCDTAFIQIFVSNSGTMNDNVSLVLTLNDSTQILSSLWAYTSLGANQYSFDIGNINANADSSVILMVKAGCDTIGTQYCFAASVSGLQFDCYPYNNNDNFCTFIGVPYDPNSIYVYSELHAGIGATDYLQTENNDNFKYTINFQNTGSAPAQDVRVETVIDEHLNLNSITPLNSSANYNWLVVGNKLIFYFDNIQLPDSNSNEPGSHGFVNFKIQQNTGNPYNTIIPHLANIFFDYLSPITTNTAIVELVEPNSTNDIDKSLFDIFPNPASKYFTINCKGKNVYEIIDVLGRKIGGGLFENQTRINTSEWITGVYFISLNNSDKNYSKKIIIE